MNKKLTIILISFVVLTLAAALWQAREAAQLEDKLLRIDQNAQTARLLQLSLPRVQAEMERLLAEERNKLGDMAPVGQINYPMPGGSKADFNCGFFLMTPAGLQVPMGEEHFRAALDSATAVTDTMRRKADNPGAPVFDPNETSHYDRSTHLPVFGVYQIKDTDFSKPMYQTDPPGPFFAWHAGENLIYMRSVPTTHGNAAEGFVIDATKLAAHLLPLVEPELKAPEIDFARKGEAANLAPLPLVLRPGNQIDLPDTGARRQALSNTVTAAWVTSGLSIIVLFSLLAFYARLERRRSDFVSAVTHELRTPLTSFNLYTEMLRQGNLSPEKVEEYHETLYQESRRLGHLVENVLSFARLTRGKVRGRQDCAPCGKLLPALFEKVGEHLRKAGFQFTQTIDSRTGLLSLRTDLLSVEQILTNLADNAIKYAAGAHAAVNIRVIQTHRALSIRFSDNGPGISDNARKQLFQPFSRSAKDAAGSKPGIGLGLALSRDLARSIGGDLKLEHSDENGTTFLLTLPLGE
ncbi:MAG: HAMP domain-containing histidine kinase [Akkermansia sp.]|nr:HAMP domain-containing histidine kinase [Akkermansia sp.]